MPRVSINIPEYTYWRLLGAGESTSVIVQQALDAYWKSLDKKHKNNDKSIMRLHQV